MSIAAFRRRWRHRAWFWALTGLALLVSHDAVFLAQMGPGEEVARALRSAGHGYWGIASILLAAVGLAGGLAAATRLRSLRRRALRMGATARRPHRSFGGRLLVTWLRLFTLVAAGFVVQESLEHLAMHSHLIGLGALIGPEYPLALPVISLITLGGALLATTMIRTESTLLAGIAEALRQAFGRAPRKLGRGPMRLLRASTSSPLARAAAGRAPPLMLVLTST